MGSPWVRDPSGGIPLAEAPLVKALLAEAPLAEGPLVEALMMGGLVGGRSESHLATKTHLTEASLAERGGPSS